MTIAIKQYGALDAEYYYLVGEKLETETSNVSLVSKKDVSHYFDFKQQNLVHIKVKGKIRNPKSPLVLKFIKN